MGSFTQNYIEIMEIFAAAHYIYTSCIIIII